MTQPSVQQARILATTQPCGAGCSPAICVPPNRFQNLIRKPAVGSRFWVCRKPLARPR
jgi:hypothetical protein